MSAEEHPQPQTRQWPRPQFETLMARAFRLRCPRCGEGKLFRGWFQMNDRCPVCNFQIERPAGYYLGSMYVNYGTTAWITTIAFMVGRLGFKIPGQILIWPLAAFCLIFPALFFRHARAFWLALDCQFDSNVLNEDQEHEQGDEG
ncbi:DUF983 domain-containing protein [Planctomicrobium sp. SH661]|uniref:DUF983 domain-containing protein n=1 Tax=Planctomicrobium sp. SH661 TaxID=3448124 RepID=UPI003F5B6AC9